jgi:hypothetical protein
VSHFGLATFTLKIILRKKEEFMETQIFHHTKILSSKKNPLKETKILQDIRTL